MISGNWKEFDQQLEWIETDFLAEVYDKVMRALAMSALSALILLTPVDTGRARNGWDVTKVVASGFMPPEGAQSYPAPDIGKALAALQGLRFGDTVWITNNVVYIKPLNDGHSKKAPKHFVELALQRAIQALGGAA